MKYQLKLIKNIIIEIGFIVLLFPSCTNSTSKGQNISPAISDSTNQQVIKESSKKQRYADSLQLLSLLKMNYNEMKILNLSIVKSLPPVFSIGAKNMLSFHQKAITYLAALIQNRNFKIKTQIDAGVCRTCDKLNKENGNQFESDVLDCIIKTHKDAISQCQQYSKSAVDSEVSAWCTMAIPVFQSHLQMAESAQKDISLNKQANL